MWQSPTTILALGRWKLGTGDRQVQLAVCGAESHRTGSIGASRLPAGARRTAQQAFKAAMIRGQPVKSTSSCVGPAGIGEAVLRTTLAAYDRMIGLELDDLSVDGSIAKSPGTESPPAAARLIAASKTRNAP